MLTRLAKLYLRLRRAILRLDGKAMELCLRRPGQALKMEGFGHIHHGERLRIGDHVSIGRDFFFQARGGITIGDYTHISRNVTIHSSNHDYRSSLLPYDESTVDRPVVIGRYAWIGMNCSILSGVTIGDGAVIGMGTIVAQDVPAGAVVVGPGYRTIGKRDPVETARLVNEGRYLFLRSKN